MSSVQSSSKKASEKREGGIDRNAAKGKGPARLRGLPTDSPDVRLSKTLSYLLRHGAQKEGLPIRADGYVRVDDLMNNPKIKSQGLDLSKLRAIVEADQKQRYSLIPEGESWLIKANQGHSLKEVQLVLKPITAVSDIPTGIAVHGTSRNAWSTIQTEGLSKMKRNHIHLAQGVASDNVVSGMRKSSQVLIFIDIEKAIRAGLSFALSDNGVILTEGDERGSLGTKFFLRVEDAKRNLITDWKEGKQVD